MRRTFILCAFSIFAIIASVTVFSFVNVKATGGISADRKVKNDKVVATPSAAFTSGNLVVYRVGDGSAALSGVATAVFLDEYTPAGALVQTIAMPQAANGANDILTAAGTATSEGFLSRSADGKCLVLGGYNKAPGGSAPNSDAPTTTNRVVGRVTAAGAVDTTTALNDPTGNIRGAATSNCSDLWLTSSSNGIRYSPFGTVGASTQVSTTVTNVRVPGVFGGQLYVSDSSGSAVRLGTVGTGLPKTSGQTITNLPGFPVAGAQYAYFFANLTGGAGFDTLYVADDTPGTINKYSRVSGSWTSKGSISLTTARGLAGAVNGTNVTLYVSNGPSLQTLTDTSGYNATITGTPTSIVTAATNTAIRGVAFTPVVRTANADFDGDGKTDFTVGRGTGTPLAGSFADIPQFKSNRDKVRFLAQHPEVVNTPSDNPLVWYTLGSLGSVSITQWGDATFDFLIPADFDGDGKDDIAIWRPAAPGVAGFYILESATNTFRFVQFAEAGSDPTVVADYDGDGKADPAQFGCPLNGPGQCVFSYIGSLNNPSGNATYVLWGVGSPGDFFPDPGDFDGDGKADFCLQRTKPGAPGQGQFTLLNSSDLSVKIIDWGLDTDTILPGDYDGDSKADIMIMRNNGGSLQYFAYNTQTGPILIANWGIAGDVPVPGDYDGDGKTDLAIWRPSITPGQSLFIVERSSDATAQIVSWGTCAGQCDNAVANWQVH